MERRLEKSVTANRLSFAYECVHYDVSRRGQQKIYRIVFGVDRLRNCFFVIEKYSERETEQGCFLFGSSSSYFIHSIERKV